MRQASPLVKEMHHSRSPANARAKKGPAPDNLYVNIEKLPGVPLKYELQSQEQMREIQRRIRAKRQEIASKVQERNAEIANFRENLKLKQKL